MSIVQPEPQGVNDLKLFLQRMKFIICLLLTIVLITFSTCSNDITVFNTQIQRADYAKALEIAEKMVQKQPDDVDSLNRKALVLIHLEREQEALPILDTVLSIDPDNDDALNNKSWALYNLEQYEQSYDIITRALEIEPNSDIEHINHGNVLLEMGRYTDAVEAYSKAIEINPSSDFGLYGLGCAFYWLDDYEQAIRQFNEYLKIVAGDADAITFLGYSYLYSGQMEEALKWIEILKKVADNRKGGLSSDILFNALMLQAEYEKIDGKYEQALQTLSEAEKIDTDETLYSMLGEIHYNLGNYTQSIRAYDALSELSPDLAYPNIQNVYNYLALENIQAASDAATKALELDPVNEESLNAMGNIYGWETQYRKAYDYFQQAVAINPDYATGHVNSLWALYGSGLYKKSVEYGESIADRFPDEPDIYGYLGDSWSKLQEIDKAVENYKKARECGLSTVYYDYAIAMEYFIDQQYDLAEASVDAALLAEPENEVCLQLKQEIQRIKEEPLSHRLADFVEQNYLYAPEIKNLDAVLQEFRQKDATDSETSAFIESIRLKDDMFTYCIVGDDYDYYWALEDGNTVTYSRVLEDTGEIVHYFDIDYFSAMTANEFIEICEELPDKEDSILIIDLRDNGGGLMESCAEMLDYLLEFCVVGNLIYRDGTISPWYSDDDAITFKRIFVLVNEYTASSSEMLTLGLKKFLPNVTVIGQPTFGKGVGQAVFDSRKDKIAVLLVNFYWSVKEENLMNSSIKPEIKASGDLNRYLEKVRVALKDKAATSSTGPAH